MQGLVTFVRNNLVGQDRPHFGAFLFEQGHIHVRGIHDIADTAAGYNQDRGINQPGNPGIGKTDHRSDSGMACPLYDEKIVFPVEFIDRIKDFPFQILAGDFTVEDLLCISRHQHDRRHESQIVFETEDFRHQCRVLVCNHAVSGHGRLGPQRLDEADPLVLFAGHVHQRQAGRSFTAVLAGCGDKYLAGHKILLKRKQCGMRGAKKKGFLPSHLLLRTAHCLF